MRLFSGSVLAFAAALLELAQAKPSWSFKDGKVEIQAKGAGNAAAAIRKEISPAAPVSGALALAPSDTLKLSLTITSASKASRPHQAFLSLLDPTTQLEDAYALDVKESGKATLSLAYKDIPAQLLASGSVHARIILGSFGSTAPSSSQVFTLVAAGNADGTPVESAKVKAPVRYGKLPEIHHVFKSAPQSPPVFITLVFAAAVFTTVPVLLGVWLTLGANLAHVGEAVGKAPLAYAAFLGSILATEAVFFAYYVSWTLFQVLPALAVLAVVSVLSGSRALTEVQNRRLAGKR